MYDPKGNGIEKAVKAVQFYEVEPPEHLSQFVHRYLELNTKGALPADYRFHALPDACTYMVFDQLNPTVTGVCKLQASSEELNLGKTFHYVNIRFLPGVWQDDKHKAIYGMVSEPYHGDLPLLHVNQKLALGNFIEQQTVLTEMVEQLITDGIVVANPVTKLIFENIFDIHTVADMAAVAQLSPRQLQRILKSTTGFTPHDFLKVLRLQQALNGSDAISYADQSHFIHSFKKATGYTPGQYSKKFDV